MNALKRLERYRDTKANLPTLIREALAGGATYEQIAEAMGVSRATVFNILKRG